MDDGSSCTSPCASAGALALHPNLVTPQGTGLPPCPSWCRQLCRLPGGAGSVLLAVPLQRAVPARVVLRVPGLLRQSWVPPWALGRWDGRGSHGRWGFVSLPSDPPASPFDPGAEPSLRRNVFQGGGWRSSSCCIFPCPETVSCLKWLHDTGCACSPAVTYLRIFLHSGPNTEWDDASPELHGGVLGHAGLVALGSPVAVCLGTGQSGAAPSLPSMSLPSVRVRFPRSRSASWS